MKLRPSRWTRATNARELTGVVTSAKMEKTIIVKVTRLVQHKLYRRVIRVSKKFYAHDEQRTARPRLTPYALSKRARSPN